MRAEDSQKLTKSCVRAEYSQNTCVRAEYSQNTLVRAEGSQNESVRAEESENSQNPPGPFKRDDEVVQPVVEAPVADDRTPVET